MKKLRNFLLLLTFMVILIQPSFSQTFSGRWEGYLTVVVDGKDVNLPFKMVINVDGNGNCGGQTGLWITINDVQYYSRYKFEGTYKGSTITFSEFEMIENTHPDNPDFYWCKKSGTLTLNGNNLSGDVNGYSPRGGCMPAVAHLVFNPEGSK